MNQKQENSHPIKISEQMIYGSSRIGLNDKFSQLISWTQPPFDRASRTMGLKSYELTDHASTSLSTSLGNVLTVISDRKKHLAGATPAFEAVIETAQDYYPFGSLMPGRKYNAGEYRYGFNRMEKDDEFTGVTGSHLDFGARIYDSRLGRWMSIDPLAAKFPSVSSYNFVKNCPIRLIDADGRDIYIINKPSEKSEIKMTNHKQIIQWMYSAGIGEELITQYIDNPKTDIYIAFGDVGGNYGLISSFFDDDGNLKQPKTIEIGNHNLYNDVRKEFKYVEINTDKENHFILIDENVFKDKASDILSKKGAEILGHEMGHINNPKTSEEEDHLKWGQESLDDIKATGRAKEYNKQIDDSMKKSDELEFKEINPRGKYKLERKK